MNILIIILIVIVALILVVLLVALFIKREYAIERSIVINKPRQEVFDYLKFLKNQDHYSKWVMLDPAMKKEFKGEDGTVGFIYRWDSQNKNAGKGEQEITSIRDGEKIDVEVRFLKPFEGVANTPLVTEPVSENQTRVRWGMNGTNKYPMNLVSLLIRKVLEKDLEQSLSTLKCILER